MKKETNGAIAFGLIYLTFFLDNVLLTVLVPIIPDWIRGESLALWATRDAPLAKFLNSTVHKITTEYHQEGGVGGSQAIVGVVLGTKAAVQLVTAPIAAAAVCKYGPAKVLHAATSLLALAAIVFWSCSNSLGAAAAWSVGAGRAAQGAGTALAGVSGLALAANAFPDHRRDTAIGALLGAVALGVLVGYPFGGASYALWSRGAPFLLLAAALLANLAMQCMFLNKEEFNRASLCATEGVWWPSSGQGEEIWRTARHEATAACAGAVLLTTSVMAALEPCLPLWLMEKFHPQRPLQVCSEIQRWQTGAVFVPDSAGYLIATSTLGGAAKRLGAERVALAGQVAVGLAALAVPHATSVGGLALPHLVLGCGLGGADAALVPALLARQPHRVPQLAALLQAASSAAYGLGPIVGGLLSWWCGFETALRTLGVLNLLYAAALYNTLKKYPLSEQWGANTPEEDRDQDTEGEGNELTLLRDSRLYNQMH